MRSDGHVEANSRFPQLKIEQKLKHLWEGNEDRKARRRELCSPRSSMKRKAARSTAPALPVLSYRIVTYL
jgi:hypothetical protein